MAEPRLLGVVAYVVVEARPDVPAQLFVQELAVAAPARRQGLATLLLQEAVRRTPEATEASLIVDRDNVGAVLLYGRLGFQEAPNRQLVRPRDGEWYLRVARARLEAGLEAEQAEQVEQVARVEQAEQAREAGGPRNPVIAAIAFEAYPNRQRLALEGLRWHGEVIRLVREAHGSSATLPHDWQAQRKVRYILATGELRAPLGDVESSL